MRLLAFIILLLSIVVGVAVGALNAEAVDFDFGVFQAHWPKGAAILGALVVGWLLGGLTAWLGTSLAVRRKRREARRDTGKRSASSP